MRKYLARLAFLLLTFAGSAIAAPDISGTWQGKGAAQHVLKVAKTPTGTFRADFYNLGRERAAETLNGNAISSINVSSEAVTFTLDRAVGKFVGMLSADGKSIAGTWQ